MRGNNQIQTAEAEETNATSMKRTIRLALLLAAGLGAASVVQAATYKDGDLIVGFTTGSGTDFIFDLGQASALSQGQTWSVGAGRTGQFGVIGTGSAAGPVVYATSSDSGENGYDPSLASFSVVRNNISTIAGGSSAIQSGQSRTPAFSDSTSWYHQTADPAIPANTFQANFTNPNSGVGSTAYLFANDTSSGAVTADSFFTYDSTSGTLTFGTVAVPEPSTYGLLAGAGLLIVSLRRQFARRA